MVISKSIHEACGMAWRRNPPDLTQGGLWSLGPLLWVTHGRTDKNHTQAHSFQKEQKAYA